MKETCILAGKIFSSRSKAKEYVSGILRKYRAGQIVEESDVLWDALALRGIEKNRADKIIVDVNGFGSLGFEFLHPDGSQTPFSYRKCFEGHTGRGKTAQEKDFSASCRTAIAHDHPNNTGKQYHHAEIPFKEIVERFIADMQISVNEVEYRRLEHGGVGFASMELEEQFRKYHREIAVLIPVSPKDHKVIHYGEKA